MERFLEREFVPWAERFLRGGDNIYGEELRVKPDRVWIRVVGTKDRRYTYAKVNRKDGCLYSASGTKPLCRHDDKAAWERIRWPCAPKVEEPRHARWPPTRWPPNVREYLRRACNMSDATMGRLVDADSYDAFTDQIYGDNPQELYEDTQVDGIGYYLLHGTSIEGATAESLSEWFSRKGID